MSFDPITVVIPYDLTPSIRHAYAFLNQYTPSVHTVLGYHLADTLLQDPQGRITADEFLRAFWSLYEISSVGIRIDGEIPDVVMETMEAVSMVLIEALAPVRTWLLDRPFVFHPSTTVWLQPSSDDAFIFRLTPSVYSCPTLQVFDGLTYSRDL